MKIKALIYILFSISDLAFSSLWFVAVIFIPFKPKTYMAFIFMRMSPFCICCNCHTLSRYFISIFPRLCPGVCIVLSLLLPSSVSASLIPHSCYLLWTPSQPHPCQTQYEVTLLCSVWGLGTAFNLSKDWGRCVSNQFCRSLIFFLKEI